MKRFRQDHSARNRQARTAWTQGASAYLAPNGKGARNGVSRRSTPIHVTGISFSSPKPLILLPVPEESTHSQPVDARAAFPEDHLSCCSSQCTLSIWAWAPLSLMCSTSSSWIRQIQRSLIFFQWKCGHILTWTQSGGHITAKLPVHNIITWHHFT